MDDPFDLGATPAAPAAPAPYLGDLNADQRAAVEALDGPVLMLAGAGTGKTRALVTRLAHILFTRRAQPYQVLAVTFTNKAAREMRERVGGLIGGAVEGLWLGTFHAMSVRILRRHAELVGLKSGFAILDDEDQQRLLKQILEAENIDPKRWPPRALAAVIDRWKNAGLAPTKVPADDAGFADGRGAKLYRAYQDRLLTLNACDFGDLLLHCLTLFQGHGDVLERYQQRFRYILVDEYQDTNVAQYLWLRLLAQGHGNLCCVGDDDQSIYGWRGAEVGNILRFESDFPGAKIIRLERNYRSTPHILAAASGVIAHNEGRLGKTLWTDLAEGEKVVVRGLWDGAEEARDVADRIETLQRDGHALNEIAILVRASFQTREFEERFIILGLPYRVIGGQRFYQRQEIKDATSYLAILAQPLNDVALERIINLPKRGIGGQTLQLLHRAARQHGGGLLATIRDLIETDELRPKVRRTLAAFVADMDRWRDLIDVLPPAELAETVLDECGYTEMWQADRSPQAPTRLDNLKELVRGMAGYQTLAEFLEHVSLVQANDESDEVDKINVMTLHAAKGLEFDTVFLPGWEEELFPHRRALEEGGNVALEEERRLAYVGITRARRRCVISHAANRQVFGQWQACVPSRFIDELPAEAVDNQAETGLYGNTAEPASAGAGAGLAAAGGHFEAAHGRFVYDAPWLRADQRATARGYRAGGYHRTEKVIDGSAEVVDEIGPDSPYRAGMRVFHQKFGYGTVRAANGHHLEIEFEKAGPKKVVDAFVKSA